MRNAQLKSKLGHASNRCAASLPLTEAKVLPYIGAASSTPSIHSCKYYSCYCHAKCYQWYKILYNCMLFDTALSSSHKLCITKVLQELHFTIARCTQLVPECQLF